MEMSALGLSGTQALETSGQSSSYPVRTKVAELVYQEPQDIRATSSRHERTTKHRHAEQSAAGTSAPTGGRTRKASSASQQAAPLVTATPSFGTNPTNSTNPSHGSRRERDKGSKPYGIPANEPRTRHVSIKQYLAWVWYSTKYRMRTPSTIRTLSLPLLYYFKDLR